VFAGSPGLTGSNATDLASPPPVPPGGLGASDAPGGGVVGGNITTAVDPTTGKFLSLPPVGGNNSFSSVLADAKAGDWSAAAGDLGGALKANSNWLVPAAVLGYEGLKAHAGLPGQSQLSSEAYDLAANATQNMAYLNAGTLPPGVQAAIGNATNAAKAQTRSLYAAHGMSGSSAEVQALQQIESSASAQGTQIAMQLLQQGVSETNISANLYSQIMRSALSQDQSLGTALATLAGGAARPTINPTGASVAL
jgi:hypothetical protein